MLQALIPGRLPSQKSLYNMGILYCQQHATAVSEMETSNMFLSHFPNSSGKESSQAPTGEGELPELGVQQSDEQRSAQTKPKVAAA